MQELGNTNSTIDIQVDNIKEKPNIEQGLWAWEIRKELLFKETEGKAGWQALEWVVEEWKPGDPRG